MKILKKIGFVLLLTTFSSVYGGSCFEEPYDVDDCLVQAEQGDSIAQLNLGMMYYAEKKEGGGRRRVPQDYIMAHMYFNLAAVNGHKIAIRYRDFVAQEMTFSQLEKAEDLAREWMMKEYP